MAGLVVPDQHGGTTHPTTNVVVVDICQKVNMYAYLYTQILTTELVIRMTVTQQHIGTGYP